MGGTRGSVSRDLVGSLFLSVPRTVSLLGRPRQTTRRSDLTAGHSQTGKVTTENGLPRFTTETGRERVHSGVGDGNHGQPAPEEGVSFHSGPSHPWTQGMVKWE